MSVDGYTGLPGMGKTCAAVCELWTLKRRGKKVFANIPLIDERVGVRKRHFFFGEVLGKVPLVPNSYGKSWADGPKLETMDELLDLDNCTVLLDEVHMWLDATEWQKVPFEVKRYFAQQRKGGIDIKWTAQQSSRVVNIVRDLTRIQWACSRWFSWSYLEGKDPQSKTGYGNRFIWIRPDIYDLYDTSYIVGNGKDKSGTYGTNQDYARQKQERQSLTPDLGLIPASDRVLIRRENQFGVVTYRPCAPSQYVWRQGGEEIFELAGG